MSANSNKKDTKDEILSLRDSFAVRARNARSEAADLEARARQKRAEAESFAQQAVILQQAYVLLQQEKTDDVLKSLDDLTEKDKAKLAKHQFVFLIDGSGSMQGAPINGALKAAQVFTEKVVAAGGAVETIMFGDQNPLRINVLDKAVRESLSKGLNCGTDLAPGLREISKIATDKKKPTHVVIFSDGDMFDNENCLKAVNQLTAEYPKITFDALLVTQRSPVVAPSAAYSLSSVQDLSFDKLTSRGTQMERLFEQLSAQGNKANYLHATQENADQVLGNLMAQRLTEKAPRTTAKPKAPKAPGA